MNFVLKNLQRTLKEHIKGQSLTYFELAQELEVSGATVKRILNQDDVSFSKLTDLCRVLNLDFYELVEQSGADQGLTVHSYSKTQESFLSQKREHFLVFRTILMGLDTDTIEQRLGLDEGALSVVLKKMEECGLIERHPFGRIKVLAKFPFKWIPCGPLEKTYGEVILKKILKETLKQGLNSTHKKDMNIIFEWALDDATHEMFTEELRQLFEKYRHAAHMQINALKGDFTPTTGLITVGKYPLW